MNLTFHSSVLFCNDLQKQREFYEVFLKQEVEMDLGACIVFKNRFSLWKLKDEFPIARELGYTYEHIGNRNFELCFETENFEDAVEKVLLSDLRILHNVEEEEWGQYTIRLYDPEGNLVEIGESMHCFLQRLQQGGMDIGQMEKKTGMPAPLIRSFLS